MKIQKSITTTRGGGLYMMHLEGAMLLWLKQATLNSFAFLVLLLLPLDVETYLLFV